MVIKMTFYIKCDYKIRRGDQHDDGDGSDYSGFDHEEFYDHTFHISDKKMNYPDATFSSIADKSYVVAVIYGDGGTFGRTDGYVQYIGPFLKEKAYKIAELINFCAYDNKSTQKYTELKNLINDKNFYASWMGYFASFEKVLVLCSDGTY